MLAHESKRRSTVKSLSYRIFSISVDSFVAYFFTHDIALSAGIVAFVNAYSTLLYFLHERVWAHINWGRNASELSLEKAKNDDFRRDFF